jgi:hypothetical protein
VGAQPAEENQNAKGEKRHCTDTRGSEAMPAFFRTHRNTAAAASIGMIDSIGNLGGQLGPCMLGKIETVTGSFVGGLYFLAGSMTICAIIVFFFGLGGREKSPAPAAKQASRGPAGRISAWRAAPQNGIERALPEADPGAEIDHLASRLRGAPRGRETGPGALPGTTLPERDRFRGLLEQRALEAWRDDRPGTALLAWTLRERVTRLPDDPRRDLVERAVEANADWAPWRLRVLAELPRIMAPSTGLADLGWTVPMWSP